MKKKKDKEEADNEEDEEEKESKEEVWNFLFYHIFLYEVYVCG